MAVIYCLSLDKLKLATYFCVAFWLLLCWINQPENLMGPCKPFLTGTPEIKEDVDIRWPSAGGCRMHNYTKDEIKQCFKMKGDKWVNIALMGDSRVRNLYEYFEQIMKGSFTPWAEKPHRNLESKYPEFNANVDFLWAAQMETGNQDVFELTLLDMELTINIFPERSLHVPMDKVLKEYLLTHDDPDILVMSNAIWSIYCKPNQTMGLEEYHAGTKRFKPMLEELESRGKTKILWLTQPDVNEEALWNQYGPATQVINNFQVHLHREAIVTHFKDLHENLDGFAFWEGPRHFVATETEHNPDGLHFAWPGTLEKINMMLVNIHCNEKMDLGDDVCCSGPPKITISQFLLRNSLIFTALVAAFICFKSLLVKCFKRRTHLTMANAVP